MIEFTIPLAPYTKKNHTQNFVRNGRAIVIPSKEFMKYQKEARPYIPEIDTITAPVNIKAVFYVKGRYRVDLVNLEQALLDILVKYGVIEDDNYKVVHSMDGSYVDYDKENPRTEVTIWEL